MIRNQWYAVLESKELKKRPFGVTRLGERLVFWRDAGGNAVCFYDRCAHRGAALALGECLGETIQCPFHGLEYDSSGRCVKIPANGKNAPVPPQFKMTSYPVHEEYGLIWIWWGTDAPADLAPPAFFDDLKNFTRWHTVIDPWDNHYTRVMENQLDVAHLPFIHRTTIGRGSKTLVEGPGFEWKGETLFFVYTCNKADDGSKPRTVEEITVPIPGKVFKLELLFPNLWQNYITEKVRILGIFVPVDETHTLLYMRFYQSFLRVPLLRGLVNLIGGFYSLIIAHQDRRVVNTQLPKADGTGKGEALFPGDYPIMEYRKKRLALKNRTEQPLRKS